MISEKEITNAIETLTGLRDMVGTQSAMRDIRTTGVTGAEKVPFVTEPFESLLTPNSITQGFTLVADGLHATESYDVSLILDTGTVSVGSFSSDAACRLVAAIPSEKLAGNNGGFILLDVSQNGVSVLQKYFNVVPHIDAPSEIYAVQNGNTIVVNWGAVAAATGYVIYRNGGQGIRIDAGTTTYTDTDLEDGATYYYEVVSVSNAIFAVEVPSDRVETEESVVYTLDGGNTDNTTVTLTIPDGPNAYGQWQDSDWAAWGAPLDMIYNSNKQHVRTDIIDNERAFAMRLEPTSEGSDRNHAQFRLPPNRVGYETTERVRFPAGFSFGSEQKAAKIGIAGVAMQSATLGRTPGGSDKAQDGFSFRTMYNNNVSANGPTVPTARWTLYAYFAGMTSTFGSSGEYFFAPNLPDIVTEHTYTIKKIIKLNSAPNVADGSVTFIVDGVVGFHADDLLILGAGSDFDKEWALQHETFWGGNTSQYSGDGTHDVYYFAPTYRPLGATEKVVATDNVVMQPEGTPNTASVQVQWTVSQPATGRLRWGTSADNLDQLTTKETTFRFASHTQTISTTSNTEVFFQAFGELEDGTTYETDVVSATTLAAAVASGNDAVSVRDSYWAGEGYSKVFDDNPATADVGMPLADYFKTDHFTRGYTPHLVDVQGPASSQIALDPIDNLPCIRATANKNAVEQTRHTRVWGSQFGPDGLADRKFVMFSQEIMTPANDDGVLFPNPSKPNDTGYYPFPGHFVFSRPGQRGSMTDKSPGYVDGNANIRTTVGGAQSGNRQLSVYANIYQGASNNDTVQDGRFYASAASYDFHLAYRGKWALVETLVGLNEAGQSDGFIRTFVDGVQISLSNAEGIRIRKYADMWAKGFGLNFAISRPGNAADEVQMLTRNLIIQAK